MKSEDLSSCCGEWQKHGPETHKFLWGAWTSLVVWWDKNFRLPVQRMRFLIPGLGRFQIPRSKSAHVPQLLKPECQVTTRSVCPEPVLCNEKPLQEKPVRHNEEQPCSATTENLCTARDLYRAQVGSVMLWT